MANIGSIILTMSQCLILIDICNIHESSKKDFWI